MARRIVGGLAGGMAHDSQIRHENYEFTGVGGPAPASAYSRIPDLHFRNLDPVVYSRRTLRTATDISIPEFTYIGGPAPSLAAGHGQIFHL